MRGKLVVTTKLSEADAAWLLEFEAASNLSRSEILRRAVTACRASGRLERSLRNRQLLELGRQLAAQPRVRRRPADRGARATNPRSGAAKVTP